MVRSIAIADHPWASAAERHRAPALREDSVPQYHFNISEGASGLAGAVANLHDLTAAKCEAVKLAGRTICYEAAEFWSRDEWILTVSDENGLTLFQLQIVGTDAPAVLKPAPLLPRGASVLGNRHSGRPQRPGRTAAERDRSWQDCLAAAAKESIGERLEIAAAGRPASKTIKPRRGR
jgi:hypothetical protein